MEQPCSISTETVYTSTVSASGTGLSTQQAKTLTESCTATAADSHPIVIYTSTGSGHQSIMTGIADTQQAPVHSAMPQPGKLTEATGKVPELQSGRVDAKKFRPRYYDIDSLEIGTWRVCIPNFFNSCCF